MNTVGLFFILKFFLRPTEVANDHSKNLSSNLNEDRLIKIEPKSTENLSLRSDLEVLTNVDNSLKEFAKKSKFFFYLFVYSTLI